MKKLITDLVAGRDINRNLRRYGEILIKRYCDYAVLGFTFSVYTFFEEIQGSEGLYGQAEKEIADCLFSDVDEICREDCSYDSLVQQMKELRQEVTGKMDLLTAYTDRTACYEYILNHTELTFLPEKEIMERLAVFSEADYMERMQNFLYGDRNERIIYDKLQMVIGEIPVQMTKAKLFEKIEEAMTLYQGGDCSSLNQFLYMLRTVAMIYEPQNFVGAYPELEERMNRLEKADYVNLTEEKHRELKEVLDQTVEDLLNLTNFYCEVQETVNKLYALCMVLPYVKRKENTFLEGREVWEDLSKGQFNEERLYPLEGKIEQCAEELNYLESVLPEIQSSYRQEISEEGMAQFFTDMELVSKLLSDSLFIDLFQTDREEPVDEAYMRSCAGQLLDELSVKMSGVSRPVKQAIMGKIIGKLPPMFQNMQQVQQYIRTNLFGCRNKAEKCVVMEMLQDVMREEEEWSL